MTANTTPHPAGPPAGLLFPEFPCNSFTLDNGLTVIVHENHDAPQVSLNLVYQVGAKDEPPGKTGYAHLFEHLMFCGSKHLPGSFLDHLLQAGASEVNASTGRDHTSYYATVPVGLLDFLLFAESDRMGHFYECLDQARLDQQRDIVLNEKRETESGPFGTLRNHRLAASYPPGHPYAHSVLGEEADLRAATLEDARAWFRTYYTPSNAVLTLCGDIDLATAHDKISHYFGHIPPGPGLLRPVAWVPAIADQRRDRFQGPTPNPTLNLFWHIPPYGHEDAVLLSIVANVLASGLGSRLVRRLVHEEKASSSVAANIEYGALASQFVINAAALPGHNADSLERLIDQELQGFFSEVLDAGTLERVKTELIVSFTHAYQTSASIAGLLANGQILLGSPQAYRQVLAMIARATPESVRQAAQRWLGRPRYVLEIVPYQPAWQAVAVPDRSQIPATSVDAALRLPPLQRATLANGLPLTLAERHSAPLVFVQLLLPCVQATALPLGTAPLALQLLNEAGAGPRNALDYHHAVRALGAAITVSEDGGILQVSLSVPKSRLPQALGLWVDRLRRSQPQPDKFEQYRQQMQDSLEMLRHSAEQIVAQVLPGLLYPAGHPYARPGAIEGTQQSLQGLRYAQVEQYLHQALQAHGAEITVTGAITLDEIIPLLEQHLAGWAIQPAARPLADLHAERPASPRALFAHVPQATQTTIAIATLLPGSGWSEEAGFSLLSDIAGYGFGSRINRTLREEKNWTYGVYGWLQNRPGSRVFCLHTAVDATHTADAISAIQAEYQGLLGERPISQEELDNARTQRLLGFNAMAEGVSGLAELLNFMRRQDYADDYWDKHMEQLRHTTLSELDSLLRQWLDPQHFTWLIAGDLTQIQDAAVQALRLDDIDFIHGTGDTLYDRPPASATPRP